MGKEIVRLRYALSLICVLMLSACASVNTDPSYKVDGKNFSAIFDKIDTPFFGRSANIPDEEIMAFINACCQTKERAIEMLENNGFKASFYDRNNKRKKLEFHANDDEDALIYAQMLKDNLFFDDRYIVILYIKDRKIYRSYAYVEEVAMYI